MNIRLLWFFDCVLWLVNSLLWFLYAHAPALGVMTFCAACICAWVFVHFDPYPYRSRG